MSQRTVSMKGSPLALAGHPLEVGMAAPDFSLLDTDLQPVSLADFGDNVKLLSVVPSLDTGVCDQQTRRFNEQIGNMEKAVVITVSVDLPFAQSRWCGASGLDHVVTLSDHRSVTFGQDYGVLIGNLRLLCRAVFILDRDNRVVYVEYVPEVTDHPDYEAALAALRKAVS